MRSWRWGAGFGVGLVVLCALVGPLFAPHGAQEAVGIPFTEPGGGAVLGTDRLGRDVFSHLLTGGTQLLVVSAVIAVAVTVLSAMLGAVAAVRPRAGSVIELAGDLVILLPAVLGILLVLTAWPQGGVAALIVVSLVFGVPYCARIFAASAASIAATGYVEAAVASGESLPYLIFREILPNLRSVFTTQLGLRFVVAIYLVSTVSFLGVPALGSDNWAIMVRDNAAGILLNPWSVLAPSVAIAIVAVGVNLVVTAGSARNGARRRRTPAADRTVVGGGPAPLDAEAADVRAAGRVTSPETSARNSGPVVDAGDAAGGGTVDSPRAADSDVGDVAVVDGLTVLSDTGAVLLAPLSFRLRAGTVTALTGASGAGKSTAMRALLGHAPAGMRCTGTVLVAGHDVFALDPAALRVFRRERIAYVGQDPGSELNPLLRVRALLAEAAPTSSAAERQAMLDRVGLDSGFLRRRVGRLSGGQQRRVALARALLRRPTVLVLDEPLAGLHGALRTEIARLIADLAVTDASAVLLSGHDTTTVHAIADTVIEVHPPSGYPSRRSPISVGPSPTDAQRDQRARGVAAIEDTTAPQDDRRKAFASMAEGDEVAVSIGKDTSLPADQRLGDVRSAVTRPNGSAGESGTALSAGGISVTVENHRILTDIDLEVRAGAALAVVGPSGAGKTTLARVIAGLQVGTAGVVDAGGVRASVGKRRRIRAGAGGTQLVTQNPLAALNPRRSVEQTLVRPLRRIARVPKSRLRERVDALLADVDLPPELAGRRPHELSGGQRQRVALARALAADPAVLICDEITTALDQHTAAAVMALLDRLRTERGTAVLLISHDMALVARHCTDLLVLDHGEVVERGDPATVLAAPTHRATAELLV
ncbi:ABC transporter ATP-binding protein/permease [Nocardia caishijiensis]|uniref:ABC transporter ATP-binding protein/permease n=1 Tax=Nocardia caishijiensis TaxID=184756 RepID=UPI001F1A3274|nr:ATP-binding cassette domain-containing protein [Nocardia caishijiensis]